MYSTYYDLNYCGLLSVALAKDSDPEGIRTPDSLAENQMS